MDRLLISIAIFMISLISLLLELTLVRVFDVVFDSSLSYLIVSCAIYSLGLSGLYVYLRQSNGNNITIELAAKSTVLFAVSIIFILPALNFLSHTYRVFSQTSILMTLISYVGVYASVAIPFFFAGTVLASLFVVYVKNFHALYFWDLLGASLGCLLVLPLLPRIAPQGIMLISAAIALWSSLLLLNEKRIVKALIFLFGVGLFSSAFILPYNFFDFKGFYEKRNVINAREENRVEKVVWDPVSKIEVVSQEVIIIGGGYGGNNKPLLRKHIAYDGGSQSSHIYPFSGDFKKLRSYMPFLADWHFWQRGVLASHYLKNDNGHNVLILGSAGGQETKAALVYGAKHVDAVEMVKAVVEIGKRDYADFNGGILNDPRVSVHVDEGRSFLRRSKKQYDIIQIFSNHTSSSIAAGNGLISPVYLQTVDAYKEYFSHLKSDGILHINHHLFPRVVTTAAAAWKEIGLGDFQKHVIVFERYLKDGESFVETLPTILIKRSPWTTTEVQKLETFFSIPSNEPFLYNLVANPLSTEDERNFLSKEFFLGDLPEKIAKIVPYDVSPPTDNKPFFNFYWKSLDRIYAKPGNFFTVKVAGFASGSRFLFMPVQLKNIFLMFVVSVLFGAIIFIFPAIQKNTKHVNMSLSEKSYFCLLGFGFISLEFTFIQLFIKLLGVPLYSFSVIIFTLLLSAGLGSLFSKRISIESKKQLMFPFFCIILFGFLSYGFYDSFFWFMLDKDYYLRVLATIIALFPVGFFLGIPLPLGIKLISQKSSEKVPWAWALNGFFTVFGGFLAIIFSVLWGFKVIFLISLVCYFIAFLSFINMKKHVSFGTVLTYSD